MITTKDLMDRYNIKTRQGIIQFVKKHLDEINHDGEEHATMQKGEWAFDTEAVRILDQLRGHFGHVQSLLMDRATLDAHERFWGREETPQRADLGRLTHDELDLYNALRDNRIRERLRLEQEFLGFAWVCARLVHVPPPT